MIDAFLFFNELDLLEIRLNSLAPYVDMFVLAESETTFSGKPKPLIFEQNKERFKDFNITHLVVDDIQTDDPWERESHQRNFLINGITDDMVMLSDIDEIPDMESHNGEEGVFSQRLYYYYFNLYTGKPNWRGTVVKRNIENMERVRRRRHRMPVVGKGWHFSTLGTPEDIVTKIEAFSHQEFNTQDIKDSVSGNVETQQDIYGRRRFKNFSVETPTGPEWLIKNKERYKHLWTSVS